MKKMQVRLDQKQVALICDGLESSDLVNETREQAEQAERLVAWLRWRAAKLWGVGYRGEPLRKRAS